MEVRRLPLPGDRVLTFRPMTGADARGLIDLYGRLDLDDMYSRFFAGRPPPVAFVEKMARRSEQGGFGLVATIDGPGQAEKIVAEATYSRLPAGDAELGITVDGEARGWVGPYLLDILVDEAARNGIPNLQAEVLATNPRMLALLEARGSAVLDRKDCPATVRLCIGTRGRHPAWPPSHRNLRLLVEASGGWWRATQAARQAGFDVIACPGSRRLARCPLLDGEPCPLADQADVIVDALSGDGARIVLDAHRRLHPAVPVCVDHRFEAEEGETTPRLPTAPLGAVVGMLQALALPHPPGGTPVDLISESPGGPGA